VTLVAPANGSIIDTVTGVIDEVINYGCDLGYTYVDVSNTTCQVGNVTAGTWSRLPTCKLITGYCDTSAIPTSINHMLSKTFSAT
jgi:hypothetical protein